MKKARNYQKILRCEAERRRSTAYIVSALQICEENKRMLAINVMYGSTVVDPSGGDPRFV